MANGLTNATKEDAAIQALRVSRSIGRGYESDYLEGISVSDGLRYRKWLEDSAE